MDEFGARNVRLVLSTVITLVLATFGVLLILVLKGDDVPDVLQGACTTLLGILTGSAVSLSAKPRVGAKAAPEAPSAAPDDAVGAVGLPDDDGVDTEDLDLGLPGEAEPYLDAPGDDYDMTGKDD